MDNLLHSVQSHFGCCFLIKIKFIILKQWVERERVCEWERESIFFNYTWSIVPLIFHFNLLCTLLLCNGRWQSGECSFNFYFYFLKHFSQHCIGITHFKEANNSASTVIYKCVIDIVWLSFTVCIFDQFVCLI